jgi:ComF family protein
VGDAVKSLLAALFPSDCRICPSSLFSVSRLPVCSSCLESIQPISQARCNVCGDLLSAADGAFGDARCPECASDGPAFERAVNYGAYTGVLRQLIHLLKYERMRPAANVLGRLTAEASLQLEGDIDVPELLMIPVPVHKVRMRSRGFNQAELIARAAQRGIEQSIGRKLTLDVTALLRVRFAESQVSLTVEERRQQIRGSFKVTSRERVKGREILLVDDVLTTGATASECARELRQAGAARVWVVTPARALARADQESIAEFGRSQLEVESRSAPVHLAPVDLKPVNFSAPDGLSSLQDPKSVGTTPGTLLRRRGISLNNGEQRGGWHGFGARRF